jgi:hypothetical protein
MMKTVSDLVSSNTLVSTSLSFGVVDVIEAALEKLGIQVSASEILEESKKRQSKRKKHFCTNFVGLTASDFIPAVFSEAPSISPDLLSTSTAINSPPLLEVDSQSMERRRC